MIQLAMSILAAESFWAELNFRDLIVLAVEIEWSFPISHCFPTLFISQRPDLQLSISKQNYLRLLGFWFLISFVQNESAQKWGDEELARLGIIHASQHFLAKVIHISRSYTKSSIPFYDLHNFPPSSHLPNSLHKNYVNVFDA